jgi:HNH endonuclease
VCKIRQTPICSELGDQPANWSKTAPLPPPAWFNGELEKFIGAIRFAADGKITRALEFLRQIRSDDLRSWYVIHGQNSGEFRSRHFGGSRANSGSTDSGVVSSGLMSRVYRRDGYQCRYCGLRLVTKEVLVAFEGVVGKLRFAATSKNASHGAALVFRATCDHVDPRSCGGSHQLENLVSACYSCNFGKGGFTLQQLGLHDPRERAVSPASGWDGLVPLIPRLNAARPKPE